MKHSDFLKYIYVFNQFFFLKFNYSYILHNVNKGIRCILRLRGAPVCQKVPKSYFQSQFSVSKINRIFSKIKIIWEYQFRRPFFVKKNIFSNFNFWTTLFSKIMPNFWRTGAPHILKIQWFPLSILIFCQKSCFLGPTIFKIPQPNWY